MIRYLIILLAVSLAASAQLKVPPTKTKAPGSAISVPVKRKPASTPGNVITVTLGRTPIKVKFQLATASRISIGVFSKATGKLVKTERSGVQTPAGVVNVQWRGDDDFGIAAPAGEYEFRMLSSNVAYQWIGTLGNTSTDLSNQSTIQRGYKRIQAMVGVGTKVYFANGYAEGHPAQAYFTNAQPQKRIEFFGDSKTGQATRYVASDGVNVYWAGYDLFSDRKRLNFIFASKVSDNTQTTFSSGVQVKTAGGQAWGDTYNSCMVADTTGLSSNTDLYKGLAVQKAGSYLFASHGIQNKIRVYNKTTGAFVRDITITAPGALAVDGANDNALWLVSGTTVTKRTINGDGTLSAATMTLSNLGKPMAVAVSTDNATLAVCDGDTSQKVKGYNASTGALSWSIGTKGGYYSNPTVSTSKFYFDDVSGGINDTYITYASDGSFWVGDSGNYRNLHFSSNRTYIDQIAYLENCYTTSVDQNNPTRLFAQYLEFSVSDYDNPATAWSLVKNYRATVPAEYFENEYNRLQNIFIVNVFRGAVTVSGHTYALLQRFTDKKFAVVELLPNAPLRFTGTVLDNLPWVLGPDGSLSVQQISFPTLTSNWKRQTLTSIDGSGNPVWGPQTTFLSAPFTTSHPVDFTGFGDTFGITTSGKLITFYPGLYQESSGYGKGYHLGAYQGGSLLWGSHMATHPLYKGDYPSDGAYDIGNGVQHGGGNAPVVGNHIFPTYHGEFWKDSQTNKFAHFYENGLYVGGFGVTGPDARYDPANNPGMAGNVFGATGVQSSNGNIYLVHGEEFGWSGLHIWRISNLSTIQVQTITATLSSEPDPRGTPMFAALPKYSVLASGAISGFVRSPASDNGEYTVRTNAMSYARTAAPDFYFQNNNAAGDKYATVPFNTQTGLSGWQVSFTLQATQYYPSVGEYGQANSGGGYIRILDNTGKTLVQYFQKISGSNTIFGFNGVAAYTRPGSGIPSYVPIIIRESGGSLICSYGSYGSVTVPKFDNTATLGSPAAVQVFSWVNGSSTGRIYGLLDGYFKATP